MAEMMELAESQDINRFLQLLEEFPSKPDDLSIGKKIGKGSNGVVHKGKYQSQNVAVKIIPDLLFDGDNEDELEAEAKTVHKFLKEVELLKQLDHAHIVKYLGAFYNRDDKEPILVMELMSKTLKAYLKENKKTLTLSKQITICLQIAEGVQFLHHQQPPLAHRDLTDKNVLVSEDGETFKIGDLGQAKLKPDLNRRYFSTATPGSMAYMPPEVCGASPHYTESIDVFSLGVLMVEVATQSPPTVATSEIGSTIEYERREADLHRMGAQHPLRGVVVKCLEDNYKHRLRIDEVVAQLSLLVDHCKQEQAPGDTNADDDSMYKHPTHVVACRRELFDCIPRYLEAARAFIAHQDSGKQLLNNAGKDLNKAFKKVAAARIAGSGMGIAGGVMGVVGGGLILGGVTAVAGVPVLAVGGALGAAGGVTGVGAAIGDIVKNRLALKQANQWTKDYKKLSETLLKRHQQFQKVLSSVSQDYNESEETCLSTALKGMFGERGAQFTLESFQSAHEQATPVFRTMEAALLTGAQALANGVLAAAEVGAASMVRGVATTVGSTAEVGAETTGAVTRGVFSGVEATAEVGATVGRTVLIGVGGAVVGLSAVFIVVDLAFLIKTGVDIHKNKKGTKLANALHQIVEDMREQTEQLRPLANLRQ